MMIVHNTTIMGIPTLNEATLAFDKGIKSRKVASTDMNEQSSRSHLIFTIMIQTVNSETG